MKLEEQCSNSILLKNWLSLDVPGSFHTDLPEHSGLAGGQFLGILQGEIIKGIEDLFGTIKMQILRSTYIYMFGSIIRSIAHNGPLSLLLSLSTLRNCVYASLIVFQVSSLYVGSSAVRGSTRGHYYICMPELMARL